jgi:hypothetical protein
MIISEAERSAIASRVAPTQLRQRLQKRGVAGNPFRIVLGKRREHAKLRDERAPF